VWAAVVGGWRGSGTHCWYFLAFLRANVLTPQGQDGRITRSNSSLHSWGDQGPEREGDLLKATSSDLQLGLGLP
jgi:hypothetical protein